MSDPMDDASAQLTEGLRKVTGLLEHPNLQPDPDGPTDRPELVSAVAALRADVLPRLSAVLPHLESFEQRRVGQGVADLTERLAAALLASGSAPTAQQLITEALKAIPLGGH